MIDRWLKKQILEALAQFPIVYVNGPRQAGKSTLAQHVGAKEWPAKYVTFDDATMLGAAEANPKGFLDAYGAPLILDEVQLAPGLFRALKVQVDRARAQAGGSSAGRYLLTGSANALAVPRLADALVGRMSVLTLFPLSAVERVAGDGTFLPRLLGNRFQAGTMNPELSVPDAISAATYPEIATRGRRARGRWFEAYLTTILQRDVRQLADIEKLAVMPNLLRVLAGRAGGLINEADVARSIGQNAVTTKNYRVLLKMIYLSFDVKPWFRNIGKRLVKSPKGYLVDTSLLCHLRQIDVHRVARTDPQAFGYILENFVASELEKQLAFGSVRAELLHFRTSDGKEVDFVIERPGGVLAGIEVKARDEVTEKDFRGLRELRAQTERDFACGIVLYLGKGIIPFDRKLWAVPVSALWTSQP